MSLQALDATYIKACNLPFIIPDSLLGNFLFITVTFSRKRFYGFTVFFLFSTVQILYYLNAHHVLWVRSCDISKLKFYFHISSGLQKCPDFNSKFFLADTLHKTYFPYYFKFACTFLLKTIRFSATDIAIFHSWMYHTTCQWGGALFHCSKIIPDDNCWQVGSWITFIIRRKGGA